MASTVVSLLVTVQYQTIQCLTPEDTLFYRFFTLLAAHTLSASHLSFPSLFSTKMSTATFTPPPPSGRDVAYSTECGRPTSCKCLPSTRLTLFFPPFMVVHLYPIFYSPYFRL
ncbi:uncharacterized protein BO95DRAFT_289024 [Aspergillus brunneoviolaceus CBS 621.78]|uniref:Uncharacterized protein n=1 Tax=Aspergillus brunneoviolaceus CBS 621.78 TaxID=1450534 RepID=A0ACD1FUW4_9EURO|nr:hypothetical protein BO95DRAFT_289024 [Aspergillus brunneoviolaceus CBS 621.78]RAH40798.1 hypothetical protein BO95DRAFT_289024 [Aspergillus brunneoviolaceus CBS 621.78]